MSENSHTLLLFCKNEEQLKACYTLFKKLDSGDEELAATISQHVGIDIEHTWKEDWFNQQISRGPDFIRLVYDTSSGYDMPLNLLQQLFDIGLEAACLEVFYSQVGELGQFHFTDATLVTQEAICQKFPNLKDIIEAEFECESDELEQEGFTRPYSIKQLLKDKQKTEKDAVEMVEGIRDLAKLSRETGEDPVSLMKTALNIAAAIKGVVHAFIFGVVTILLFKGLWFWICLTLVLLVALPLYYIMELDDDMDELEADDDESGGDATC